jgi:hypothetical protein
MTYRFRYLKGFESKPAQGGEGSAKKTLFRILLIFLPILVYVFFYMQSLKLDYKLDGLRKDKERYTAENKVLELKLKSIMSGAGVEQVAKSRYGFKEPEPGQVYIIKKK